MKTTPVLLMIAAVLIAAPIASAEPQFESAAAHTIVKGTTGSTVLSVGSGNTVTCSTRHFESTMSSSQSQYMLLTNELFTNCTAFGFANTHVDLNGCTFELESTGNLGLNCPGSERVEITPTIFGFSVCTATVFPGTYATVSYDNVANGDIEATTSVSGMVYEESSGSCGVGEGTDGSYSGTVVMAGTNTAGEAVDIEVE